MAVQNTMSMQAKANVGGELECVANEGGGEVQKSPSQADDQSARRTDVFKLFFSRSTYGEVNLKTPLHFHHLYSLYPPTPPAAEHETSVAR